MDLSFIFGAIVGGGAVSVAWFLHAGIVARIHAIESKFSSSLTVTKLP